MQCVCCGSAAVTERRNRTAQGYRRFRCRDCGRQFNERSAGMLNRTRYPSDVIALVVLWRLRYRLTLRDLAEMFLHCRIVFSHDRAAKQIDGRDWEAKLTPVLAHELRQRRDGKAGAGGRSWFVDETYLRVRGRWCYLYRAIDRQGAHRHHAQRAPRHGCGHGVLPVRNVRRRHDPGPCQPRMDTDPTREQSAPRSAGARSTGPAPA
jgi:putative transposase